MNISEEKTRKTPQSLLLMSNTKEKARVIEEYLDKFEQATKDPTLDAMFFFMEKFDNPHKKVKMIHIGGTNGKGSIVEMMTNVLINAGYRVGKYMSPHLVSFNERISVNNKEIEDKEAIEILTRMDKYIQEYNETHEIKVKWFEVVTSLAYIFFAEKNCDIAVIEVGIESYWDCTNIIEPEVSMIAKIGYDHVDFLGSTIQEITEQNAGIIKENSHTVFFNQEESTDIIEKACNDKNNKLHLVKKDDIVNYKHNKEFQEFDYKDYKGIKINLKGKAQTINASECLECIDILKEKGYSISDNAITKGLSTVIHKARLEVLRKKPLVVFDGGHNESAIMNLRENIELYYEDYKDKVYIISLLKSKDYKAIIKILCENNNAIFIFTNGIDKERYVSNEDLYNEAKKYVEENKLAKEELEMAIKLTKQKYLDSLNLVVGSFYVYKEVCESLKNN